MPHAIACARQKSPNPQWKEQLPLVPTGNASRTRPRLGRMLVRRQTAGNFLRKPCMQCRTRRTTTAAIATATTTAASNSNSNSYGNDNDYD